MQEPGSEKALIAPINEIPSRNKWEKKGEVCQRNRGCKTYVKCFK